MRALSHLVGSNIQDVIDEIEMFAVLNHHALNFVRPSDTLGRKKMNVCVADDGTIRQFVFTDVRL
jgi:hypothetical protein